METQPHRPAKYAHKDVLSAKDLQHKVARAARKDINYFIIAHSSHKYRYALSNVQVDNKQITILILASPATLNAERAGVLQPINAMNVFLHMYIYQAAHALPLARYMSIFTTILLHLSAFHVRVLVLLALDH